MKFGSELGRWRGVSFYSSDYASATSRGDWRSWWKPSEDAPPLYAGSKFQCVEASRRALMMLFGITYQSVGMAYEIFDLPHFFAFERSDEGRDGYMYRAVPAIRCANGQLPERDVDRRAGIAMPMPGALLINREGGFFRGTGHVSVITEIVNYGDGRKYGVRVAEQNVHDRSWLGRNYSRELPASIAENGGFTIQETARGASVLGWIAPITLAQRVSAEPQPQPQQQQQLASGARASSQQNNAGDDEEFS